MTNGNSEQFALRLKGISKAFGGLQALDNVDFEVLAGEVHCLAGENGCGKSTLIKVITGVYQPEQADQMELFGERLHSISPTQARAKGVSVIWQDLALFPHMSVQENIAFDDMVGLRPRGVNRSQMRARATAVLERLGVALDMDLALEALPIAQRQIVAIARALMNDARLIFMDEPTASLTKSETDALLAIVRKLSSDGVAVVFVSHRLAEVIDIASRVTVLRDGKLVGVYSTENMTQARLGELMTGQTIEHSVEARTLTEAEPVLELSHLSRTGEFEDVSFSIRAGEVVGLTGLIGSGRTELAHVLMGMRHHDGGTMMFDGQAYAPSSIRDAIRKGMAYVSEDRLTLGLLQKQSIADNTVISVLQKLLMKVPLISMTKKEQLVSGWIKELGVKIGHQDDPISSLSGGNQQKVVLAKWLATDPRLLILDSPTVGVDVGARAGIFRIVRSLAENGLAILLISDEVTEVMFHSDRILHMADGRIIEEYNPHAITVPELEERIYA